MANKSVLIADADPTILRALTTRCQQMKLDVRAVADGVEALMSISKSPPAVAILAATLPSLDALAIAERVLKDPQLSRVNIICLADETNEATARHCEALGISYLEKAIDAWDRIQPILATLTGTAANAIMVPTPAATSPTGSTKSPNSPPKVLVVDDDPGIPKAIQIKLRAYGVEVLCAYTGKQGYWMAVDEKPDVVITDYTMPDGYGNYVLGQIKSQKATRHIPVIVLTGRQIGGKQDYALEREMLSLGTAAFLRKPLDFDALLTELRRHIPLKTPTGVSAGAGASSLPPGLRLRR